MDFNWLWISVDVIACMLIVIRLLFGCERSECKFITSLISYFLILACSWIIFRIWCDCNIYLDPAECFINVALCLMVWRARGNLGVIS